MLEDGQLGNSCMALAKTGPWSWDSSRQITIPRRMEGEKRNVELCFDVPRVWIGCNGGQCVSSSLFSDLGQVSTLFESLSKPGASPYFCFSLFVASGPAKMCLFSTPLECLTSLDCCTPSFSSCGGQQQGSAQYITLLPSPSGSTLNNWERACRAVRLQS